MKKIFSNLHTGIQFQVNVLDIQYYKSLQVFDLFLLSKSYEGIFLIILIIFFQQLLNQIQNQASFNIPIIPSTGNHIQAINNTLYGYPILLGVNGNIECSLTTLSQCSINSLATCCQGLFDVNTFPYQSVSDKLLIFLSIYLPLIIFFLHIIIWRYLLLRLLHDYQIIYNSDNKSLKVNDIQLIPKTHDDDFNIHEIQPVNKLIEIKSLNSISNISNYYFLYVAYDIILGFIICIIFSSLLIEYMKERVGYPRPNYYTLQYMYKIFPENKYSLNQQSHRSFPSGHASTIATGLGYIIIFLLDQAYQFHKHIYNKKYSTYYLLGNRIYVYLSIMFFIIIIWVGVTRIRDYWHFPSDVFSGWLIGFIISFICYFSFTSPIRQSMIKFYLLFDGLLDQRMNSIYELSRNTNISIHQDFTLIDSYQDNEMQTLDNQIE